MSTYILRSIRSFCHVRNTRKDNYPICTKHAFSSCKVNHSYLFHIYLFICSLSYIRYIFLFFLLSFTLDSYIRPLTLSFFFSPSFPFISFFSLAHIHSSYAQKTDNIQFDISYMRKRTKTKFAHYVPSTYIITIYMYI